MVMKKGKATISKCIPMGSSVREKPFMRITLEDNPSFKSIIEINISLFDFADAITGKGYIDCKYTLYKE